MLFMVLFAVAFACQIFVVSVYFPRGIVRAAQGASPSGQTVPEPPRRFSFRAHIALNNAIACVGLLVLGLCLVLQSRGAMTGTLLCIGLFFLLQISTLVFAFARGALPIRQSDGAAGQSSTDTAAEDVRIFDILPPVPVGIAVALYVSFLIVIGLQWGQFEGKQIAKIVVLTLTNLAFAASTLWTYRRWKNSPAEQAAERHAELTRMAPTLVFGSILVTVYYFTKEVMFGLDLHELRPAMMSVFLQLIAIAVYQTVMRVVPGRESSPGV